MKYTVIYGRKVRVAAYDMLDVSLTMEFDTAITPLDTAFDTVKSQVNQWIQQEQDRLLEKSVPRPKAEGGQK